MAVSDRKFVVPNGEKIWEGIKRAGITQDKLSTMVLGKNASYISQSISRGSFDAENLRKLCEFLSISYDECVVSEIKRAEKVELSTGENADIVPYIQTLVAGLNTMYESQKEYAETMKQYVERVGVLIKGLSDEVKTINAKQNRLENALGQIVQNSLITKENTAKVSDSVSAVRSQLNIANNKLKELVDLEKKNEKTSYKVVQSSTGKVGS